MLPVLFSLGPITFYTFGFFLGVGFFLAAFLIWRRLRDLGFKEEKIIDGIILWTIWGLVFSRIFFIIQNFGKFGFLFDRWLLFGRYPGFSFWGAIIGFFWGLRWFCRKEKWEFWRVADEVVFGILPFFALAELGTFLEGNAGGRPTSMPWGVFFPGSLVRQHPVSLFAAFFLLGIWVFLLRIEREWRSWEWLKNKEEGFISLVFFLFLFLTNFLLAFLKDSVLYLYWLEIILSGLGFIATALILWKRRKK